MNASRPLRIPAAALGLLAAVAGAHGDAGSPPPPGVPVERFVSLHCAGCHGPDGQGTNPMFPKLAGQQPDYLFREMLKFRSGARRGTVMQVNLAAIGNRDVAVLAMHFSGQRRIPDRTTGMPSDVTGEALYRSGNASRNIPACASCHDRAAPGAARADPMPRLAGQHAAYLENQLFRFVLGERQPGQAPRHPVVDLLDDAEIRSVSRYLSGLD